MPNFLRGLNKLVSNTQIGKGELSVATDIQLIEDGKVQCPRLGQGYFGNSSGTRVNGIIGFYQADGSQELVRMSGTTLQKLNTSTLDWDNISGAAYTDATNANMVMAYDNLYICNGVDSLTKYDGSTVASFSAIDTPAEPTVTRNGGGAGSYTFSYKVTAKTDTGETAPSDAGTTTLDQGTLTSDVYMDIEWVAVTGAVGYNLYGRTDGSWYFIATIDGNTSVTYEDKGLIVPEMAFPPPEADTTEGPLGTYITVYKDSLFICGDPDNPSRLYYSGGGDKVSDFTIGNGGGFVDIAKNDGTVLTGLIVFKNRLLVFKEDSIYQFSLSSAGLPQITQINPAIGCIAPRSIIAVENDVYFASRRGVFTVGNEPGYAFDVLRTNELSAKVRPVYQAISSTYMSNMAAVYATVSSMNLVIFAYTPSGGTVNSKALVFDRDRMAWYEWTNINANCWTQYIDTDNSVKVLYGDDSSGYVCRALNGSDDFGSGIHGYFSTGALDFKALNYYKKLKDIDLVIRSPTGTIAMDIVVDGVTTAKSINMSTISPTVSWSHYVWNTFVLGKSVGEGVTAQDDNLLRTMKNLNIEGRSFLFKFDNNSSASFVLLEMYTSAKPRSLRYRHSGDVVST